MKIGVFDSGLGGKRILDSIRDGLGQYEYVYYGDTKNLPYGDKTEEEIYTLTRTAVHELFQRDVLLIVIACNTASAESTRRLQDEVLVGEYRDRRILGVIVPTIEELILDSHRVTLIGTRRTVDSQKYERELEKRAGSHVSFTAIATPELVPLIESNALDEANAYLESFIERRRGEMDTLVLGCTHYTVLKGYLRKRFPDLKIISQDEIIPKKLSDYLQRHPEIESRLTREGTCVEIITGSNPGSRNGIRE